MASIADQMYEYLISNNYSPEDARKYADRVSRNQNRQELTTAAVPLSVMLGGLGTLGSKLGLSRFAGLGEAAPSGISASEQAIIQAKNPGRMINPQNGTPMSFAGKPAMIEGSADPYVGLFQKAQEVATAAKDRAISAFQPQIPRNPVTGAKIPTRDPATGRMVAAEPVYSTAQKIGIPAAIGTPLVAAGYFGREGEEAPAPAISPEDLFDMRSGQPARFPSAEDREAYLQQQQVGNSQRYPASRPVESRAAPAPERTKQVQQAAADPQNMTIRQLWEAANASGEARDFARADQAMQAATKKGEDVGFYGQSEGKKAGGSVNGKDAAMHKALEIIHHMITSR
jgi:hypothetical protein